MVKSNLDSVATKRDLQKAVRKLLFIITATFPTKDDIKNIARKKNIENLQK